MSYELEFHPDALKEWRALDLSVREQLKKKLAERLREPHVVASRLSGHPQRYKIKLRSAGFRLVYEVQDSRLVVLVVAVGKRERNQVYKTADRRTALAEPAALAAQLNAFLGGGLDEAAMTAAVAPSLRRQRDAPPPRQQAQARTPTTGIG